MPGGSAYPGPSEALDLYAAVVEGSASGATVKGAKNPYTSLNGHMFSFLDADGVMALRLPHELHEDFLARYGGGPVMQYGRVMQGYVSVPEGLVRNADELVRWFDKSHDWIGTLPPSRPRSSGSWRADATAIVQPDGGLLARVDVDSGRSLEDHSRFLGVDAVGAGVVDEEREAVGGEPHVAAFAALA